MGAHKHPTTTVDTDDPEVRKARVKNAVKNLTGILGIRDGVFHHDRLVIRTTGHGLPPEAVSAIADEGGRIVRDERGPFEVVFDA